MAKKKATEKKATQKEADSSPEKAKAEEATPPEEPETFDDLPLDADVEPDYDAEEVDEDDVAEGDKNE